MRLLEILLPRGRALYEKFDVPFVSPRLSLLFLMSPLVQLYYNVSPIIFARLNPLCLCYVSLILYCCSCLYYVCITKSTINEWKCPNYFAKTDNEKNF